MKSQFRRKRIRRSYRPHIEFLEDRLTLSATAWSSFGGDAQHTSISSVPSQNLEAVHWSTKVDNFPTSRAAHYGGPLVTLNNTVIYPYKTGNTQSTNTPDYHIVARSGNDGALVWDVSTPYVPPDYSWYPQNQPVFATATNRVYFAGSGGTIYYRDNPDSPTGTVTQLSFYGSMASYLADKSIYDSKVFIETPLTADAQGNIFFGFRVTGANPANLVSGIARISSTGTVTTAAGSWVSATAAAGDANIGSVQQNGAPAISNDGQTLYIVVKQSGDWVYYGRMLGLNTTTLATQYNSGVLKDPRGANAAILNQSTSSPMVAPDGRVFIGVFGNPYNGSRGWMLQFSGDLQTKYTPGGFGWDTTPSIVPSSLLGANYTGTSPYLIFTKYNNYYFAGGGNDGGQGDNRIAILDPNDTEVEFHNPSANTLVMKRVLTQLGPTADWDYPSVPTAVREWCINYGAVDPATNSVIVNSSDGKFYRWNLLTNTLIQPLTLTSGIGQPYTMTVVGVDGTLYGIQMGQMFALGQTPQIVISNPTVNEGTSGSTTATFTVSLDYPRTTAITVNWATANDSAIAGLDYTAASGTLTFAPGVKTQTISVTINPDQLDESDEQFFVNLSNVSNAIILDGQALATIIDDDASPTLTIGDFEASEGNTGTSPYTIFTFPVTMSTQSGQSVGVQWQTVIGTAQASDLVAANGSLMFAPGETSKTITILVVGDLNFENTETFLVNLFGGVNISLADDQGLGTIINDDGVPSLSINDVSVNETGLATLTVSLNALSIQNISVNYSTIDGTAGSADYTAKSGTLNFSSGTLSLPITIQTNADTLNELAETFSVNLSAPTNAFLSDAQGIVTIIDDDPQPNLSINDVSAFEGASGTTAFTFTIQLSAISGRNVTVNYATANGTATTANSDYAAASGSVAFAPGDTSKTITVLVNGDSVQEADETFVVNLTSPSGAGLTDAQGQGTIQNDDATVLSIADVTQLEGDSGAATFTFTVNLSTPSSQTATVDYSTANGTATTADGDYTATSGTLTFNPGEIAKTFTVSVAGDARNEIDETFLVNLTTPVGASIGDSQAVGTIHNDDALPSFFFSDFSEPEMDYNQGTINVYVQLSAPSGQTVTVAFRTENGTATSTSNIKDYIDTLGTLTFLPGETVKSFPITVVGDIRVELDETVRLILSNPTNSTIADDLAIFTITNDDRAQVLIEGTSLTEGDAGQSTANVTVTLSNPSDYALTIDYATIDGSALAGLDYVGIAAGTVTFAPSEMSKTISVQVLGDLLDEFDEDFEVVFSNATVGAYLPYYPEVDVDIVDNDTSSITIADKSQYEGNNGTTSADFTVSLSIPADHPISIDYATTDGGAKAGVDYTAASGTLTFAPGEQTKTIPVSVLGDTLVEFDENFAVTLTNPTSGAGLSDAQAIGLLLNDDFSALSLSTVLINGGAAFPIATQRSQVVSLAVNFSGVVSVDAGAFTLENMGIFTASSSFVPTNQLIVTRLSDTSYIITFAAGAVANGQELNGVIKRAGDTNAAATGNSLADGNYKLTIDRTKVHQADGQTLTGNNLFGASYADKFFRLYGDSDGDGDVDAADSARLRVAYGTANQIYDWDSNGSVVLGTDDTIKFNANYSKKRRIFP